MRKISHTHFARTVGVLALAWIATAATAQNPVPVSGVVTNAAGQPVPGVAVSMVHPSFGRSASATTDQFGRYLIGNVRPASDPYYVEVYWGQRLIYRQPLKVSGPQQWDVRIR